MHTYAYAFTTHVKKYWRKLYTAAHRSEAMLNTPPAKRRKRQKLSGANEGKKVGKRHENIAFEGNGQTRGLRNHQTM